MMQGAALLALSACGFTPIYGNGSAADRMHGLIAIGPLEGQNGFDMRERLETRLGVATQPAYILNVEPVIDTEGLAITPDGKITRYNLSGTASFTLTTLDGTPVYSGKVEAFTAYNATGSAYATRVAQQDANRRMSVTLADKIVTQMAVSARDWLT